MTATVFLIQTVFGFYILAVVLRFLLQWVRADFYNPALDITGDVVTMMKSKSQSGSPATLK